MNKSCANCGQSFQITEEDRQFLDRLSPMIAGMKQPLPEPTLCVDCRVQRRMAHMNELNLFKNTCGFVGKTVISDKHPSLPFKVYSQPVWFSDKWDARDEGRDFDFSRPFFEQYRELQLAVPYPSLYTAFEYDENSEYTNYCGKDKNCYLIFDSDESRDCFYSYSINSCVDCTDLYRTRKSELCSECIDCLGCYGSSYLQDCANCSDSMFLQNCTGCKNCLFCCNLQNKEYFVENKQVTPEEFRAIRASLKDRQSIENAKGNFAAFSLGFPKKSLHGQQNENVTGDYLVNCKDAFECFDGNDVWEGRRLVRIFMPAKDSCDCEAIGEAELLYECCEMGYGARQNAFCMHCLNDLSELLYCSFCEYSKNLFGCVGIRRKQYCILNKQYTKEEYEALVPKIIAHMRKTGEWGEFFPVQNAVFGYNDTMAQLWYPLEKSMAQAAGCLWREPDAGDYLPQTAEVPDSIDAVTDELCKEVLCCETCGKNYKVIAQELALLRKIGMPVPKSCFLCRHMARMAKRNPRKLFDRQCMNCSKDIRTTYAPDRPETVYCEECYLQSIQ